VRVLYLCHRIPYPPDKGDKIRAFHQLQAIAARHEVDLFTLADRPEDLVHQESLRQYCRQVTVARISPRLARLRSLPFLLTRKALTLPYFYSAELVAAVRKALQTRSYDRIFVYCSSMAQYVDWAEGIPVVVDLVDVDSDKWIQYASFSKFPFSAIYRREGRALQRYEHEISGRSAILVVSTQREADVLRQVTDSAPVHVVPNGVDSDYFSSAAVPPKRTVPMVIFTGDMSYFPNQEAVTYFAREVLPLVRRSVQDVRFLVVGRNPGKKVLGLREVEGVEVTGFVPDVRTYLAKAHLAVAPFSIAAGIQNKILEAMSYGLPVVATSKTKQGLSPEVGRLVATGDTPRELSHQVVTLLRDSQMAARKGAEGRQRVMRDYQWEVSLSRLLQLIENAADPKLIVPVTLPA
jgi:polysaccharide biosynthesis protein PslH